jgi:hypothetical protein
MDNSKLRDMWEIEIKLDHEWEVMYHTFENIEDLSKEIHWIMGHDDSLEQKIPFSAIQSIRAYKLNKH